MNLSQIEYFLAASDMLNFTAAANSLYISQPALSKQVKLLEAELGVKLFCRGNRRVYLTQAGEIFRNDLAAVLRELDRAVINVRSIGKQQGEQLKIGCFQGTVIDDLIYLISEKYKLTRPEIDLVFRRCDFKEIQQALINNTVDIILTIDFEATKLHSFHAQTIFTKKLAFVYSEKSPLANMPNLSVDSFSATPFLVLSPEISRRGYTNALLPLMQRLRLTHQEIESYDNWDTLLTYLRMGHGFTIMFDNACRKMDGLRQFLVPQADFQRSVVAVWKNESLLINHFIDNLKLLIDN